MLSVSQVPSVGANEKLSRFVLSSRHFRKDNETVKADAFVPHPYEELSVNRDLEATDDETWAIGRTVANGLSKTLYGRGDVIAAQEIAAVAKFVKPPLVHG